MSDMKTIVTPARTELVVSLTEVTAGDLSPLPSDGVFSLPDVAVLQPSTTVVFYDL